MPRKGRPARKPLKQKLRPRGVRFSFVGCIMMLFTGTFAFMMFKFPQFLGLKLFVAFLALINSLFFIRFRDRKKKSLFDRMMAHKFFPRKLAFTNEGKFLVLISLGMGFAAVNTGSNLLYLLLGMLLSIIMASGILSEFSVQKVSWTEDFPGKVVAGEETLFATSIRNDKKRLNSFSLEGELLFHDRHEVKQVRGTVLKLAPGGSDSLFSRVIFPRRGVYEVIGYSIGTRYPFSFFRKSRNFQLDRELLVVPRGDRDVESVVFALASGFEENANAAGRGSEFFSVRPMNPGDEWRDVHWKQSAKYSRFAVKEYEAMTARRVYVRLSRTSSPEFPDPETEEEAIEIAASIVKRLAAAGFELGLSAPGTLVMPHSGPSAVRQIFQALAVLDLGKSAGKGPSLPVREGMDRDILVSVDLDTLAIEVSGARPGAPQLLSAGGGEQRA